MVATVTGHNKLAEGIDKANDTLNEGQAGRDALTGNVEKAVTRVVGMLIDKALGLLVRIGVSKFNPAAGTIAGKVAENLSGRNELGEKAANATLHPAFQAAAELDAYTAAGVANYKQSRIDDALEWSIEASPPSQ
jgi:hypothetical protein